MNEIGLDYFYGAQAEQFSFYRLPKLLITDKRFSGISSDAKILYGVMLERMSLSMKNGWFDEKNRVYIIFTLEDVMETFACSERKAGRLMNELDSRTGAGLVEKRRQGLGKPNIIYLKNFVSVQGAADTARQAEPEMEEQRFQETQIVQLQTCQNWQLCQGKAAEENAGNEGNTARTGQKQLSDCSKERRCEGVSPESSGGAYSQTRQIWQVWTGTEKPDSGLKEVDTGSREPDQEEASEVKAQTRQIWRIKTCQNVQLKTCQNGLPNKTDYNKPDESKTDSIYPSIYPSDSLTMSEYAELIRDHIEYDILKQEYGSMRTACLDELVELMAETLCLEKGPVRIGKKTYPNKILRDRLLRLNASHMRYVMDSLHKNTASIQNMKAYLLTVLLNAPLTMDNAYGLQANHDLYAADR